MLANHAELFHRRRWRTEWQQFLEQYNSSVGLSRRGNYWANAVFERFFNLFKRKRIRRKKYKTGDGARRDVFDYIQFFYNLQCKQVSNCMQSSMACEQQQKLRLQDI